ncbi:unnamed protein product, partial [Cylicostephanus goldi]
DGLNNWVREDNLIGAHCSDVVVPGREEQVIRRRLGYETLMACGSWLSDGIVTSKTMP